MDYTIEVWTIQGNHFAQCSCGWWETSLYKAVMDSYVNNHKIAHVEKRESVEIV